MAWEEIASINCWCVMPSLAKAHAEVAKLGGLKSDKMRRDWAAIEASSGSSFNDSFAKAHTVFARFYELKTLICASASVEIASSSGMSL